MDNHYDLGFNWVLEAIITDIKNLGYLKELSERLKYLYVPLFQIYISLIIIIHLSFYVTWNFKCIAQVL